MRRALLIALACSACRAPDFSGTALLCGAGGACPSGFTCCPDGRCRDECPATDGSVNADAGEPDAGPADAGRLCFAGDPDPACAFDPATRATELATAQCERNAVCIPASIASFGIEETCTQYVYDHLIGSFETIAAAHAAGRLAFAPENLATCIEQMRTADCDYSIPRGGCRDFLVGTRARGEGCRIDHECAPGLYCDTAPPADGCTYPPVMHETWQFVCMNEGNTCGTCRPYAARNQSCDGVRCHPTLRCANFGTIDQPILRCLTASQEAGESCSAESGLCSSFLVCMPGPIRNGAGVCTRRGRLGEMCDPSGVDAPPCNGVEYFVCVNGTCVQSEAKRNAGDTCDNQTSFCVGGLYCNTQGRCARQPAVNEPCVSGFCGRDARCAGGVCVSTSDRGAPCTDGAECLDALLCVGQTGEQMCGSTTFELCE